MHVCGRGCQSLPPPASNKPRLSHVHDAIVQILTLLHSHGGSAHTLCISCLLCRRRPGDVGIASEFCPDKLSDHFTGCRTGTDFGRTMSDVRPLSHGLMGSQELALPRTASELGNPAKRRRCIRQVITDEMKAPSSLSEWPKGYKKCTVLTFISFPPSMRSLLLFASSGQFTVQWSDDKSIEVLPVSRVEPIDNYEAVSVGEEVIGRWGKTGGRYKGYCAAHNIFNLPNTGNYR